MGQRQEKVSQLLKEEISRIIRVEIDNPKLGFATITRVDVNKDLKHAMVYVSIFADESDQKKSINILKKAKGFIKKNIGQTLSLRYIPELIFVLDKSAEYSVYMDKKIERLKQSNEN